MRCYCIILDHRLDTLTALDHLHDLFKAEAIQLPGEVEAFLAGSTPMAITHEQDQELADEGYIVKLLDPQEGYKMYAHWLKEEQDSWTVDKEWAKKMENRFKSCREHILKLELAGKVARGET